MADQQPHRIAIVDDYEIVIAGVAAMLEPFSDRLQIVEYDTQLPVISNVDVILYDTFGQVQGDGVDLEQLVRGSRGQVVIFSWNTDPELVERAMSRGAAGYLSKELEGEELVAAIEAICEGQTIIPKRAPEPSEYADHGDWPGRAQGLTAREAEVIALITQGLSNQEIAERTYLSINSVKTYIRTAYRKMDVGRRSQAVMWGVEHGFRPDKVRVINDPDQRG